MQLTHDGCPDPAIRRCDEHELRARISAEFREMPGLKVTLGQAARLFSVDPAQCASVLGALVEGGVLSTDGRAFGRAGTDRNDRCL
jgi:hypothetical protein